VAVWGLAKGHLNREIEVGDVSNTIGLGAMVYADLGSLQD
jgi:hypothetical protein